MAKEIRVIAGRPVCSEIRLGQTSTWRLIQVLGAVTFAAILLLLTTGCDGELQRLQEQAAWYAKLSRTLTPKEGELVTIRELGKDRYIVRRYHGGLISTDIVARGE